jgi:peptidyl-prolyl cis-trans isomerase D
MFNLVHTNKRLIQVVVFLIFLPFAFFGMESYFQRDGLGAEVARVGDYRITQQEFQQTLRERQDAMRRMVNNAPLDQSVLDSPEMRFAALEQIVRERLLLSQAVRAGMRVTDEQLRELIMSQQAFRLDGKFSSDLYDAFLRNQGMSPLGFEASLRHDLLQQPLMDAFAASGFLPRTVVERIVRLSEQTREVSTVTIAPAAFAAQVSVDDAAVKAYYDSRAGEFRVPEQVRLEYVVLSLDNLAAQVKVPEDEVLQAYKQSSARFTAPEERDASHILVQVPASATAEAKAAAHAKAADLVKQLQATPERFGEFARAHSDDPGSARSGGDLGFLERGATQPPFDDALFSMKSGEIRGPVETEFGYHVIRLNGVRGGSIKPFEEVRATIEADMRRAVAQRNYAELAEQLNNMAYEQSDSLKPAAEALKLEIQQSPWIARTPTPGSPLGSEKFLSAAFSEDVIKNKRNSEVVEVAPGTLISARALEYKPAALRPFEEVQADIRKRLSEAEARKRAVADGRAKLEKLVKGEEADVNWGKPLVIGRADPQGLGEAAFKEAFRADAHKLPAFVGAEDPQLGYQLIRVTAVNQPAEVSAEARAATADQLKRMMGQELLSDYVAALKRRVDVKIKPDLIEKK